MEIIVSYFSEADRLTAEIRPRPDGEEVRVEWSDDLHFCRVGRELSGFEIWDFRYFTDYTPLYRLFGGEFVSHLSDLQSRVVNSGERARRRFEVPERTRAAEQFKRGLVGA